MSKQMFSFILCSRYCIFLNNKSAVCTVLNGTQKGTNSMDVMAKRWRIDRGLTVFFVQ